MLIIDCVEKAFKTRKAVDGVSFKVLPGEIFGIVGPDGAGKSTILRMISTIMKPDRGNITIDGKDIYEAPYETKEKLAYMPQRFGLYEDLTVEENIEFFGKLFGLSMKEIDKKKPELYSFSRLGPFKNRLAGKLSGGMKQKLGLACCLVHRPRYLLLDEPTNGVDPVSRREFWHILYQLLSEGISVIVSTAYLDEAERCNRIAMLYEGRIIRIDEPGRMKSIAGKKLMDIRAPESRRLERILKGTKGMPPCLRTGASLHCFVENGQVITSLVSSAAKRNGLRDVVVRTIEPSLEDVFIEMVSREVRR